MVGLAARVTFMKELWTAQMHILMPPTEFGDTRALTNVVAWAEDAESFTAVVSSIFTRRHWSIQDRNQSWCALEDSARGCGFAMQAHFSRCECFVFGKTRKLGAGKSFVSMGINGPLWV